MKKLTFFLTFMLFVLVPLVAQATPPRELVAKYDISAQILLVEMKHVTIENREHFIRTITVTVNGGQPQIFHYAFQKYPSEFAAEIPLTLAPGDKVHIKASCKLGGSAEIDMSVPIPDSDGQQP